MTPCHFVIKLCDKYNPKTTILIHNLYNNYTTIHINCPLLWYRLFDKILHLFTFMTFRSHPYLSYSVYKIVAEVGT